MDFLLPGKAFARVALASALLAAAGQAYAQASGDCEQPIQLGDKPDMGDYAEYSDFLVQAMAFKSKEREQNEHRKSCPELYLRPPEVWPGPENLDTAVNQANERPPIDYATLADSDRTNSRSFPLPQAGNDDLATEAVNTTLATLDFGALSEAEQQQLILLAMNNQNTEDGALGSGVQDDFFFWNQILAENATSDAFAALAGPAFTGGYYTGNGVLLVDDNDDVVLTKVEMIEITGSCLGSCGEFVINIGPITSN